MSLKKKTGPQRREFTKEFKLKVLAELDGGLGMAQVARKYQLLGTRRKRQSGASAVRLDRDRIASPLASLVLGEGREIFVVQRIDHPALLATAELSQKFFGERVTSGATGSSEQ